MTHAGASTPNHQESSIVLRTIYARTLYAVYMLAPIALCEWHVPRLSQDTARELARLFS
jgi:hypothetical protein